MEDYDCSARSLFHLRADMGNSIIPMTSEMPTNRKIGAMPYFPLIMLDAKKAISAPNVAVACWMPYALPWKV